MAEFDLIQDFMAVLVTCKFDDDMIKKIDRTSVKLMSHLRKMTKLTKWKSDKN